MVSEDIKKTRAAQLNASGIAHVPCATCGMPTPQTHTKRCDGCWEVESRLAGYLRDGGDKAIRELVNALAASGGTGYALTLMSGK